MLQTLDREVAKEPTMPERVFAMARTARVERLRETFLSFKPNVSIGTWSVEARILEETAGEPMITRRAKLFAAGVRETPIEIYPDELLAGWTSVRQRAANSIKNGPPDALGYMTAAAPPRPSVEEKKTPQIPRPAHYGHNIHAFDKVVKEGFLGIKKEAEERLARIDDAEPGELSKIPFLKGVVMAMEAAAEIGPRCAARARELAEKEEDSGRRKELLKMAEVCDQVPANPARTFYEALQSYYFAWQMVWFEAWASQGRVDQCLYPYYEADIREGRITKEEAQELLDCYILKVSEVHANAMGVGGLKADGSDATNEVSYMFVESIMHTRLPNYFAVLIHSKTPDGFLIKSCELCSLGDGNPQFLNSDVMVDQALARGTLGGPAVTLEDARSAANVGCGELAIPGKDSGYLYVAGDNLALSMDLVMTNGIRRSDGQNGDR